MAIYVRSLLNVYVSDSQRMTQLLKCHIRQRRGKLHAPSSRDESDVCLCVCVCVCQRLDKVIVLSEFGELVDSQKPQETGDQSCANPTTITSAKCTMQLRKVVGHGMVDLGGQ